MLNLRHSLQFGEFIDSTHYKFMISWWLYIRWKLITCPITWAKLKVSSEFGQNCRQIWLSNLQHGAGLVPHVTSCKGQLINRSINSDVLKMAAFYGTKNFPSFKVTEFRPGKTWLLFQTFLCSRKYSTRTIRTKIYFMARFSGNFL